MGILRCHLATVHDYQTTSVCDCCRFAGCDISDAISCATSDLRIIQKISILRLWQSASQISWGSSDDGKSYSIMSWGYVVGLLLLPDCINGHPWWKNEFASPV